MVKWEHSLLTRIMKLKNILLGLVAGAGLGVLFAPKTGKELREKIKKEREEGGTGFEELKEAMSDSAVEVVNYSKKLWAKAEKFFDEKLAEDSDEDGNNEESEAKKPKSKKK